MLFLLPAEALLAATHSSFTLPLSAEDEAFELCQLLPCRPCCALARTVSETPLVKIMQRDKLLGRGNLVLLTFYSF